MAIEITTGGVTKSYRYFPYDAIYVDANGSVNTSGNGRQVREAYFNGVKYYPEAGDDTFTILCGGTVNAPIINPNVYYYPSVLHCVETQSDTSDCKRYDSWGYGPHELILPSCIDVGDRSFKDKTSLIHADLPVCTSIGYWAFGGSFITSIEVPECVSVGEDAFTSCRRLTEIKLPKCTSLGRTAFNICSALTKVELPICPQLNGGTFISCHSLTEIDMPLCTTVGSAEFSSCELLTTAKFPLCTAIQGSMFNGCTSLTTAEFPVCTSVGQFGFDKCSSLTEIELPLCTSLARWAFRGCTSLQTITLKTGCTIGPDAIPSTCEIIYV